MRHLHHSCFFSLIIFFGVAIGCARKSSPAAHSLGKKTDGQIFAVKNVNVIPMTLGGIVLPNVMVIIKNQRIASINGSIPAGATIIDGSGKWLIPGLIDMHVHVPTDLHFGAKLPTQAATIFFNTQDNMTPYIAHGVTTIFELSAKPEHFGQRTKLQEGMSSDHVWP